MSLINYIKILIYSYIACYTAFLNTVNALFERLTALLEYLDLNILCDLQINAKYFIHLTSFQKPQKPPGATLDEKSL